MALNMQLPSLPITLLTLRPYRLCSVAARTGMPCTVWRRGLVCNGWLDGSVTAGDAAGSARKGLGVFLCWVRGYKANPR